MHRAVPRRRAIAGWLAERAGRALRSLTSTLPGAAGGILIAYGAGRIYGPLLFIVGGALLVLLDRRVP